MERAKIVVVGAGPAGIATAVEAGAAGLKPVAVLEKKEHACDTIVSLYHEGKMVDPVYRKTKVEPGGMLTFTTESREDFLARMEKVIVEYGLDIRYGQEVLKIFRDENSLEVRTGQGLVIEAPVVVIAIGVFGRPVKPSYLIPREIRDRIYFSLPETPPAGKKVLVVGGGDSAAEAACFLSHANRVILSYRRAEFFRINEGNIRSINASCRIDRMELKMASDIEALKAEGDRIMVRFAGGETLLFDAVFYFLGGTTPRSFLEGSGVVFKDGRPQADEFGATNIGGLFLAGDLVADKGSIMAAFNSGARVVKGISSGYPDLITN